ncbi:MAG: aminotransferase class V-fold PLP-dependent enzyme, partial [Flavobacteriales bacterium]
YHAAIAKIKKHVNAGENDVAICANAGMTGVQNKLLRILGLRIHEKFKDRLSIPEQERPVVFVTHMEHHSNQTSWLETICDVEIIRPDADGRVDLAHFAELLERYADRPMKIAAVTACSNVTGIITPYSRIAEMIHAAGGLCFVDFACSAPYVQIDMHPKNQARHLDAIYFSPHKFLGGPGSSGVLIFDSALYHNQVPDNPGGGTVEWTNPWQHHRYIASVETREDGGTPPFLQTIRAAMAISLKEAMGVENMLRREHEQMEILWPALQRISGLHILADGIKDRLNVVSFYIDGLHFNLGVRMLNDRFGIQVRGGCSCAGTYGHYLLHVTEEISRSITDLIDHGDLSLKPGWIRLSLHPTSPDSEVRFIAESIAELAKHHHEWAKDYDFDAHTGHLCFANAEEEADLDGMVHGWFDPAAFTTDRMLS